jgi:ABC-2 type transport system ATP-binding protein
MFAGTIFWFFSSLKFQAEMGILLALLMTLNTYGGLVVVPSLVKVIRPSFLVKRRDLARERMAREGVPLPVHKTFGSTVAVRDVSFSVARGEVVGFLGPNGAGKSTTLRMLTGVFPPTSGWASIAGHDVVRDAIGARRSLGYLPERAALYGDMQVERYLRFIADMKRIDGRDAAPAVRRAMGAAGIEHVAHRLVGNLSKGYRQRVGIAQALLGEPPVLILDEPTSGLDPEQVSEIRGLIQGLGAERTVILSTHILSEVESICSRVIIMDGGRILAGDAPSTLGTESSSSRWWVRPRGSSRC